MEKIPYVELICKTYDAYEKEIREYEAQRTGDPECDKAIDHLIERPKAKLEVLEVMFEIEMGERMFTD